MELKKINCYLCDGKDFSTISKGVRDNPDLHVLRCKECGLVFLDSFGHIAPHFYENSGMHKDSNQSIESWIRDTSADDLKRLKQYSHVITNKSVLDFGCGNGGFLSLAKNVAASVIGIELEKRVRDHWNNSLDIYESLDRVQDSSIDVITAFHVVEHLSDPLKILSEFKKKLAPNGLIIIEVPNSDDALLSIFESNAFKEFTYWSQHLYLYNSSTLRRLISKSEFKLLAIAYYQRYPLSNHLHWLAKGLPGGHKNFSFLDAEDLNMAYANSLSRLGATDSLVAYIG